MEERMKKSIYCSLSLLEAWREGRIQISIDKNDAKNHLYSINTIMNILENNLLEGVHEPTDLIVKKGRNLYEVSKSI